MEEGMLGGRGMDGEDVEAQRGERRLDLDLERGEPVLELAAVEHHLQRRHAEAQHGEAEEVEGAIAIALGLLDRSADADERQHADRKIDVEHPAPIEIVGEIAAERRSQDRPHHDADAPERHRRPALLAREDVEQDRLRERHQRRAEDPLQQAEGDDLRQRLRRAAEAEAMVKPITEAMKTRLRP